MFVIPIGKQKFPLLGKEIYQSLMNPNYPSIYMHIYTHQSKFCLNLTEGDICLV